MTLTELQALVGAWIDENFPDAGPREYMKKFEKESKEFIDSGGDPVEAADCLIVLLAHAHTSGTSLFVNTMFKMGINSQRYWERQEDGTYQHVEKKDKEDKANG